MPLARDASAQEIAAHDQTTAELVLLTCCLVVRNWRVLDAFEAREADDARRAANGLGPRRRKRRRHALAELADAGAGP